MKKVSSTTQKDLFVFILTIIIRVIIRVIGARN